MEREVLRRLCLLNQLSLTDTQKDDVISFFAERDADTATLDAIDTENVERMVHVMPILTVVREDGASQPFSVKIFRQAAPETMKVTGAYLVCLSKEGMYEYLYDKAGNGGCQGYRG